MPTTFHCDGCGNDLTDELTGTSPLTTCPYCGVALNPQSVQAAGAEARLTLMLGCSLAVAVLVGLLGYAVWNLEGVLLGGIAGIVVLLGMAVTYYIKG